MILARFQRARSLAFKLGPPAKGGFIPPLTCMDLSVQLEIVISNDFIDARYISERMLFSIVDMGHNVGN